MPVSTFMLFSCLCCSRAGWSNYRNCRYIWQKLLLTPYQVIIRNVVTELACCSAWRRRVFFCRRLAFTWSEFCTPSLNWAPSADVSIRRQLRHTCSRCWACCKPTEHVIGPGAVEELVRGDVTVFKTSCRYGTDLLCWGRLHRWCHRYEVNCVSA